MKSTFLLMALVAGTCLACDNIEGERPEIQARGWLGDGALAAELARPGVLPLVVGYLPPDRPELADNLAGLQRQFGARAAFIGLSSGDAQQVRACLGEDPEFPVGYQDASELCACKADAYILDPGRRVVWQGRAEQLCAGVLEEHLTPASPLPEQFPDTRDFRKVVRALRNDRLGAAWEVCRRVEDDADASDWERETAGQVVRALEEQAAAWAAEAEALASEGHYRQAAEQLAALRQRFEGLPAADAAGQQLKAWSQDGDIVRAVEVGPLLERAREHEEHGCWAEAAQCWDAAARALGSGAQGQRCLERAAACRAAAAGGGKPGKPGKP